MEIPPRRQARRQAGRIADGRQALPDLQGLQAEHNERGSVSQGKANESGEEETRKSGSRSASRGRAEAEQSRTDPKPPRRKNRNRPPHKKGGTGRGGTRTGRDDESEAEQKPKPPPHLKPNLKTSFSKPQTNWTDRQRTATGRAMLRHCWRFDSSRPLLLLIRSKVQRRASDDGGHCEKTDGRRNNQQSFNNI